MNICVLIPAYCPDQRLVDFVEGIVPHFSVLVIDDGCGTSYLPVFDACRNLGAQVLRHEQNRGKGAALKTGIRRCMEMDQVDGIVTADADGQHTLPDLLRVAEALKKHPDTVILGARTFQQMPSRSKFGNTCSMVAFRLCTGLKITDTQTGLRGLPASLFSRLLEVEGERYEYEMNMLLSLRSWKAAYLEVPIQTLYFDENAGSHFHALRDGLRVFSQIIKYGLSSIAATLVDYAAYLLFLLFFSPAWSYVFARAISCGINYYVNCRMVFRRKVSLSNAGGYFALVLVSTLIGSVSVGFLTSRGFPEVLTKLVIDGLLFFVNYLVQKHWIFPRQNG